MKSLWIKLILIVTFAVAGNPFSLAQTPENLYQKSDERIEKKGDVETYQRLETNLLKHKNEVYIARNRLNSSTWKQPHLDRIGTALSRGHSPDNAFWGKEDSTTHHLINGETLILTLGTQSFLPSVLQFLKTAGKSLITGGILTIISIYILLMLIIQLLISYTNKREWKFII
jgi:hypothetical protein